MNLDSIDHTEITHSGNFTLILILPSPGLHPHPDFTLILTSTLNNVLCVKNWPNYYFSTTFDTSFYTPLYDPIGNRAILGGFGLNHYKSQSEKYHTTGPREYLYKKPNT